MPTPHLYRLLFGQLRRWVAPKTQRPTQRFAAIVAVILQAQTLWLCRWLPCPSDRHSQDQSRMEYLSYFVRKKHISAEFFYTPVPKHFLQTLQAAILQLTPDRKTLLEQFYLMRLCVVSVPSICRKVCRVMAATRLILRSIDRYGSGCGHAAPCEH